MYKYNLRVHGEYLIKDKALPKGATENGTDVIRAGKSMSGLEVVCAAKGDVSLAADSTVTINLLQSMDDETFIALPTKAEQVISAEKTSFEDGEVIARMTLPSDCMPYIKGNLATDDAAASGNFDLFLAYLPR